MQTISDKHVDVQYKQLLSLVKEAGADKDDRTGTGTISVFGHQMRFNLLDGFPLATSKKIFTKGLFKELLWFISGDTNNHTLKDEGVGIWNDWDLEPKSVVELLDLLEVTTDPSNATVQLSELWTLEEKNLSMDFVTLQQKDPQGAISELQFTDLTSLDMTTESLQKAIRDTDCPIYVEGYELLRKRYRLLIDFCKKYGLKWTTGYLGPVYGEQWRRWVTSNGKQIDQLKIAIETLRKNPTSRRIIVTAWNPELMPVEGNNHLDNIMAGLQVLPPCHTLFQFYAQKPTAADKEKWVAANPGKEIPKYKLSCQLYQRSH